MEPVAPPRTSAETASDYALLESLEEERAAARDVAPDAEAASAHTSAPPLGPPLPVQTSSLTEAVASPSTFLQGMIMPTALLPQRTSEATAFSPQRPAWPSRAGDRLERSPPQKLQSLPRSDAHLATSAAFLHPRPTAIRNLLTSFVDGDNAGLTAPSRSTPHLADTPTRTLPTAALRS